MKTKHRGLEMRAMEQLQQSPIALSDLEDMSIEELRREWLERTGRPCGSSNTAALRKRLAYHIQEQEQGGLSERARARLDQIAPDAPLRWRQTKPPDRDPRLPPPGYLLTRVYDGVEHRVEVHEDHFVYRGQRYSSLSKVAREITGSRWNGFAFFDLKQPWFGDQG